MKLWFFLVGGVVLVLTAGLQVLIRPPAPGERGLARVLNRGTVRAVFFMLVGVVAVLVGLGVIPVTAMRF